jgi:hypothetical protein
MNSDDYDDPKISSFGDMKPELTVFQTEIEKAINDIVEHLGKQIAERRIAGLSETYITGTIKDQDLTFWIYSDGAAFLVGRRHRAFERPDYEALLDLSTEFLNELMKALQSPGPASRN